MSHECGGVYERYLKTESMGANSLGVEKEETQLRRKESDFQSGHLDGQLIRQESFY